jgi:hypothetical protein
MVEVAEETLSGPGTCYSSTEHDDVDEEHPSFPEEFSVSHAHRAQSGGCSQELDAHPVTDLESSEDRNLGSASIHGNTVQGSLLR